MEIFLGIVLILATIVVLFGACCPIACPLWLYIIGQLICLAVAVASYFVGLPLWVTILTAIAVVMNIVARIGSEDYRSWYAVFVILGLAANISGIAGCFVNL